MRKVEKEILLNSNSKNTKKMGPLTGCVPDVHPQQKQYEFDELTIDSCFDSGNMAFATKFDNNHVRAYQKFHLNDSITFGYLLIALALLANPVLGHGFISESPMLKNGEAIPSLSRI